MPEPIIRTAQATDLAQLATLRREFSVETKQLTSGSDDTFELRFANWFRSTSEISRWWLAESDEAMGLAHLFVLDRMPAPTYDPGKWGYVSLLYVRPVHRGCGIGARLLRSVEVGARTLGLTKILLNPTEKAIGLYRRCGYEPADSHLIRDLRLSH